MFLISNNVPITVTMSKAVYNTNSGSRSHEKTNFEFYISGGTATLISTTPISIVISENVCTLCITLNSSPVNWNEILTGKPITGHIFDVFGNAASTIQSNNRASLKKD